MIATESATTNQQGQLTPDQRATIGGWLTGQQLRTLPALLPLAALLALALLLSGRLTELLSSRNLGAATVGLRDGEAPVSILVVPTVALLVVAAIVLYALGALRRLLAYGAAKATLGGNPQLEQSAGTIVQHGREQVAVLVDGRTWNLEVSRNVCREARQLPPGAYTFFAVRLPVPASCDRRPMGGDGAWLLAGKPVRSGSQTGSSIEPTLLQTLATTNGFLVEALPDNRAGRLSPQQADAVAAQFRGKTRWTVWLGVAAIVIGGLLWLPLTTPEPDQEWVGLGLAVVGLLVVAYSLGPGRARQTADIASGSVSVYEGAVRPTRTLSQDDAQPFFYQACTERFSVSQSAFEALDGRYRYRLYYLPWTRQMVNIEPIGPLEIGTRFNAETGTYGASDAAAYSTDAAPLTAAEISRVVGQPVGKPEFRSIGSNRFWTYPLAGDKVSVGIVALGVPIGVGLPINLALLGAKLKPEQRVENLGDEAFFEGRHLVVRNGPTYLVIDAPVGKEAAANLARLALSKTRH